MAGDRANAGVARDRAARTTRDLRGLNSAQAVAAADIDLLELQIVDKEPAGAVADHEAAADPHTGYQRESEKGVANGYAGLGAGGLIPMAQIATGTPDGTKFVRDDGTLATPAGGGGGMEDFNVRRRVSLRI